MLKSSRLFRNSINIRNISTCSGSSNSNSSNKNNNIKLYSCGSGWSGQLGLGNNITEQYTPKLIDGFNEPLSKIDKIKTGSYHAILSKDNKFYVWGQNNFGQLGLGNYIVQFKPIENKLPNNNNSIKSVECGAFHSLISTNDNKTYSFGWNERLQCGHENNNNKNTKINQPKEIEFLNGKEITAISCGFDYTIVATKDDGVYVFGMNDKGQCATVGNGSKLPLPPIKIKELNNIKIKKITSGWGHSLLLTQDGELLSWGSNQHGQCGIGIKSTIPSPISIVKLPSPSLKVLDISCGSCVSSAILSDQKVYIWGSSGDGKLGFGNQKQDDILLPTLIPTLSSIEIDKISFGTDHCIALPKTNSSSSSFYCWGFGQHGCLGFGETLNQLKVYSTPEINNFFNNNNNNIIDVKSSLDTSFFLLSEQS